MGNLQSIRNAFEVLGAEVFVTSNPNDLEKASAIILPGVGAFRDGMRNLEEKGFIDVLEEQVLKKRKPYLGICLGMQFLANSSHEHGLHRGLGWINGEVKVIKPENIKYKVPHIGWNEVKFRQKSELFNGLGDRETFYFVHSYYADPGDPALTGGETDYGIPFASVLIRDNLVATQFHPEKSGDLGLKLYDNFFTIHVKGQTGTAKRLKDIP